MKVNWYVLAPLSITAFAWICAAAEWSKGSATDWFGCGLLVGLGVAGIVQSIYRKLLQMADEEIDELQGR